MSVFRPLPFFLWQHPKAHQIPQLFEEPLTVSGQDYANPRTNQSHKFASKGSLHFGM